MSQRPGSGDAKPKPKPKEKAPPPPPPPDVVLQVRSIAWPCMDFRLTVPPTFPLSAVSEIIASRHPKPFKQLELFKDDPLRSNSLFDGSVLESRFSIKKRTPTGLAVHELYYDFFPYADPYAGRPFAGALRSDNLMLPTTYRGTGPPAPPLARREPAGDSGAEAVDGEQSGADESASGADGEKGATAGEGAAASEGKENSSGNAPAWGDEGNNRTALVS